MTTTAREPAREGQQIAPEAGERGAGAAEAGTRRLGRAATRGLVLAACVAALGFAAGAAGWAGPAGATAAPGEPLPGLVAGDGCASGLPPGHPPIGIMQGLPPGHPPVRVLPRLPAGHPPIPAAQPSVPLLQQPRTITI